MVPAHIVTAKPVTRLRVRPVAFGERPRQARRLRAALQGQDGFDGGRDVIAHGARDVAAGFAYIVRVVVAKFRAQRATLAQQGVRLRFVAASGQSTVRHLACSGMHVPAFAAAFPFGSRQTRKMEINIQGMAQATIRWWSSLP